MCTRYLTETSLTYEMGTLISPFFADMENQTHIS